MTEPPRPPGEGAPGSTPSWDPTSAPPPSYPASGETPSWGNPPPAPGAGAPPPAGGGFPPPGNYPPPGAYPPPGNQPPGGGYPPGAAGYPPGGGGPVPAGYPNDEDKTWALAAHFGGVLIGFIAPLIALLVRAPQSPTVRAHSVEALNFQITWGIATVLATVAAACSFGLLFFLPFITWLVVVIFSILGGIKANEGHLYRYPMTFRLVK